MTKFKLSQVVTKPVENKLAPTWLGGEQSKIKAKNIVVNQALIDVLIKAGIFRSYPITTVNAATYDLLETDYILHVTYTVTGAVTITLPTAQTVSGERIIIKDAGGNAGINNITIDTEGSETIDGDDTAIINGDYD